MQLFLLLTLNLLSWRCAEAFTSASTTMLALPRRILQSTTTTTASSTTTLLMVASTLEAIPDRQLVLEGMDAFRQGKIADSIAKFDASVPPGAAKAYLWQRGISYYYNDQFALGSQQFRDDVLRSPLDVEEIVWDIACLLRMNPTQFPPPTMMALPPGKKDRRLIMVSESHQNEERERHYDVVIIIIQCRI
jgi:hypothetical protein